jgi:hypothetical protein
MVAVTGRTLAQLAHLFAVEADALLPDPYVYPPEQAPSPEAEQEAARLRIIGHDMYRAAKRKGFGRGPDGSGTDAAFGYLVRAYPSR